MLYFYLTYQEHHTRIQIGTGSLTHNYQSTLLLVRRIIIVACARSMQRKNSHAKTNTPYICRICNKFNFNIFQVMEIMYILEQFWYTKLNFTSPSSFVQTGTENLASKTAQRIPKLLVVVVVLRFFCYVLRNCLQPRGIGRLPGRTQEGWCNLNPGLHSISKLPSHFNDLIWCFC